MEPSTNIPCSNYKILNLDLQNTFMNNKYRATQYQNGIFLEVRTSFNHIVLQNFKFICDYDFIILGGFEYKFTYIKETGIIKLELV